MDVYSGLSLQSTVTNILPFTTYSFTVSACTIVGCLASRPVSIRTLSDFPEQQMPPSIKALSTTALAISWQPPLKPNGLSQIFIVS